MMNENTGLVAVAIAFVLAGCAPVAGDGDPDGETFEQGWQSLVSADWTLDAGVGSELCVRRTLDEDVYVQAIETSLEGPAPTAVSELRLTVGEPVGADGMGPCGDGDAAGALFYAGGPTTLPFQLPDTVAVYLPAGSQVVLALELTNSTDAALAGAIGVHVATLPEREVTGLADAVVVGEGELRLDRDTFLFGVAVGDSQGELAQVLAHSSFSGEVALLDADAGSLPAEPQRLDWSVPMRAGEAVEVVCAEPLERATTATGDRCGAVIYRFGPAVVGG